MISTLLMLFGILYLMVMLVLINRKIGNPVVFFLLAPNLLNFVVKPIYLSISSTGFPNLYADFYFVEYVLTGLIFEFLFICILVVMIIISKLFFEKPIEQFNPNENARSPLVVSCFITLIAFSSLIFIFGAQVLPQNRSVSLTTMAPWLRYIFPFILFSQVIIFAELYRSWLNKDKLYVFLSIFILWLGFFLLNQRGIVVSCLLIVLGHSYLQGSISKWKLLLIFPTAGFISIFLKLINTGSLGSADINFIVEGPDSAVLQVWSIAFNYVLQNGHDFGQSIMFGIFGIFPHTYRIDQGILTTTDILNLFYSPEQYIGLGFGFNGSLTQGLYVAFGNAAVLAYIPFAAAFIYLMRRSEGHFNVGNYLRSIVFAFVAVIFIGGGFQTLHWLIPITIILLLARVKLVAN